MEIDGTNYLFRSMRRLNAMLIPSMRLFGHLDVVTTRLELPQAEHPIQRMR
jgi:hypothetical protein